MRVSSWRIAFGLAFAASAYLLLAPQPVDPTPSSPGFDKAKHALLFAGLALLALPAFPRQAGWRLFLALLGYGIAVELLQARVPGRAPESLDALADAAGAAVALIRRRP